MAQRAVDGISRHNGAADIDDIGIGVKGAGCGKTKGWAGGLGVFDLQRPLAENKRNFQGGEGQAVALEGFHDPGQGHETQHMGQSRRLVHTVPPDPEPADQRPSRSGIVVFAGDFQFSAQHVVVEIHYLQGFARILRRQDEIPFAVGSGADRQLERLFVSGLPLHQDRVPDIVLMGEGAGDVFQRPFRADPDFFQFHGNGQKGQLEGFIVFGFGAALKNVLPQRRHVETGAVKADVPTAFGAGNQRAFDIGPAEGNSVKIDPLKAPAFLAVPRPSQDLQVIGADDETGNVADPVAFEIDDDCGLAGYAGFLAPAERRRRQFGGRNIGLDLQAAVDVVKDG